MTPPTLSRAALKLDLQNQVKPTTGPLTTTTRTTAATRASMKDRSTASRSGATH
ncbi:MAG: hypothetical protein ACYTFM_04530 [Planctomycetota bacterium]